MSATRRSHRIAERRQSDQNSSLTSPREQQPSSSQVPAPRTPSPGKNPLSANGTPKNMRGSTGSRAEGPGRLSARQAAEEKPHARPELQPRGRGRPRKVSLDKDRNVAEVIRRQAPEHQMKTVIIPTVVALLVDLMSFTLILPLLPTILQKYKETDTSGLFDYFSKQTENLAKLLGAPAKESETVLMGGLLGSLFCLLQFVSAPLIGAFSDMYGRRPALLWCMAGICVSHVVWMGANTFPIFILARIIGGLARANISLSTTIVADDCPEQLKPKGMAMIGIAFSIGFTVGPGVGAYFAKSGDLFTPAIASLVLSLMSMLIVFFFVNETLERRQRRQRFPNVAMLIWPPHLFNFRTVSVGNRLRPTGWTYFIYIFFYSGLEFTLTFLTHTKFGYTPVEQGKMFTVIGIIMIVVQGGVTRRLTPDMVPAGAKIGILFTIPAFVLLGFCEKEDVLLYIGLLCYSIGSATVGPCLTAYLASKVTRPNEKGVALGIFRSLGALARGFGPMFASFLFWSLGPNYAYWIGAGCLLIPLIMLSRMK